jgi:glycosyltransferase involved in cell wall biosynthesis
VSADVRPGQPCVSILLPFRDAADTLAACLASCRRQTLVVFELIAVDDGSEDDSAALVRRQAALDPRIRLLQPGRVGLVGALNLGLAAARGTFIARMDADDVMHPERLQRQARYLAAHPQIALVACQVSLFPPRLIQAGYREYIRWQNACLSASSGRRSAAVRAARCGGLGGRA